MRPTPYNRLTTVLAACVAALALMGGTGCESSDDDTLSLAPETVSLDASTRTNLQIVVFGGIPPFTWETADPGLGTLATAGDTAIYSSRSRAGQNQVTVRDGNGVTATATIMQLSP